MTEGGTNSTSGKTILLVEDEAIVGMGICAFLEESGHVVHWTTNVRDALGAIDELPEIDAAIVDYNLDGVMSTPVIERLLDRNIHTMLCTGYNSEAIDPRFRQLRRAEKPFTRASLRSFLNS